MRRSRPLVHLISKPMQHHSSGMATSVLLSSQGDLNNISAARPSASIELDPDYSYRSLAITEDDDDPKIRKEYRPFLLKKNVNGEDWIEHLELATVTKMASEDIQRTNERPKVLVLFGSLRERFVDPFSFEVAAFACQPFQL